VSSTDFPDRVELKSGGARLLDLWQRYRHTSLDIGEEEQHCIEDIVFDTMSSELVQIVSVERLYQAELVQKFCEKLKPSLTIRNSGELQPKKTSRKQMLLLHGTRWENAPLICEDGLDPQRGYLSAGAWLGRHTLCAHTYAAKGPGPVQDDGRRLFAIFAIACLPSTSEGDEERSFGVWRIMGRDRMCPAYLIVYSAPMDVRGAMRSGSSPKRRSRGRSPGVNSTSYTPQHALATDTAGSFAFQHCGGSPPPKCSLHLPPRMPSPWSRRSAVLDSTPQPAARELSLLSRSRSEGTIASVSHVAHGQEEQQQVVGRQEVQDFARVMTRKMARELEIALENAQGARKDDELQKKCVTLITNAVVEQLLEAA